LNDLLDGTSRFYLNYKYRNRIFSKLKDKYKDWRIVARNLNIPTRSLFGLRRGWEYRDGCKKMYPIGTKWLKNIQNLLNLKTKEIEENINIIKLGTGGHRSKIKLPILVDLNNEPINNLKRALAEYIFIKKFKKNLKFQLNKDLKKKNNYIMLKVDIEKEIIDKLKLRGLQPKLKKETKNHIIYYRNPNVNKIIKRIIPKQVVFNEIFSKEFGKWCGDRCGGSHQIGLLNKEKNLIKTFYKFLITKLDQPEKDVNLSIDRDSYYRVFISNKLLREKVFNFLEDNLFTLLYNSKKSVRYVFYAGLFEAEGSISQDHIDFVISSFGFNLKKKRNNNEILDLLKKVIKFSYLLKKMDLIQEYQEK
tara:strand:+ start:1008 stop:2093 length:1086 start_codon:yes stop_codon:yes gene_type:complete